MEFRARGNCKPSSPVLSFTSHHQEFGVYTGFYRLFSQPIWYHSGPRKGQRFYEYSEEKKGFTLGWDTLALVVSVYCFKRVSQILRNKKMFPVKICGETLARTLTFSPALSKWESRRGHVWKEPRLWHQITSRSFVFAGAFIRMLHWKLRLSFSRTISKWRPEQDREQREATKGKNRVEQNICNCGNSD